MPTSLDKRMHMDTQTLYFARWGTMIALVWAQCPENAELRVRHQCFDRRRTLVEVTRYPALVKGEVLIREATEDDRKVYAEWSSDVPA